MVTRLGSLPDVNTKVVEGLFASDLDYLQALYERLNAADDAGRPAGADRRPAAGAADDRIAGGGSVYALGEA